MAAQTKQSSARAAADVERGDIIATVDLAASPERVFAALASAEVTTWWVRPGVFDTREWSGDVKAEGAWRASGIGGGRPYTLEGEFVQVDPPRKLAHSWRSAGEPASTTVTYRLDATDGGTRVTLRHEGFTSARTCAATSAGWETSFERLEELLARA